MPMRASLLRSTLAPPPGSIEPIMSSSSCARPKQGRWLAPAKERSPSPRLQQLARSRSHPGVRVVTSGLPHLSLCRGPEVAQEVLGGGSESVVPQRGDDVSDQHGVTPELGIVVNGGAEGAQAL